MSGKCTGKRCPMQAGVIDPENCKAETCAYRSTERDVPRMDLYLKIHLYEIQRAIGASQWHAKWIIEETETPCLVNWKSEEQREKAERILTPLMNRIKDTVYGLKQDMEKALKEMEGTIDD